MSKYRQIAIWNIFGIALFLSYYFTREGGLWLNIDSGVFWFFNDMLIPGTSFLTLAAVANMRFFDVVAFSAMAALYLYYFVRTDNAGKRKMISVGVLMLLTAVTIKQCGRFIPISHPSPTLFFDGAVRLKELTNMGAKDAARNSFPGDHGMMLMIFAAFMGRYHGWRALLMASLLVIVFSMPRIISGAHWFSDIYVGSLSIVSVFVSWFLLTPASDWVADKLTPLLPSRLFSTPSPGRE